MNRKLLLLLVALAALILPDIGWAGEKSVTVTVADFLESSGNPEYVALEASYADVTTPDGLLRLNAYIGNSSNAIRWNSYSFIAVTSNPSNLKITKVEFDVASLPSSKAVTIEYGLFNDSPEGIDFTSSSYSNYGGRTSSLKSLVTQKGSKVLNLGTNEFTIGDSGEQYFLLGSSTTIDKTNIDSVTIYYEAYGGEEPPVPDVPSLSISSKDGSPLESITISAGESLDYKVELTNGNGASVVETIEGPATTGLTSNDGAGNYTFSAALPGVYTIKYSATVGETTVSESFTVTVTKVAASLSVSLSETTIFEGESADFTVVVSPEGTPFSVTYADGSAIDPSNITKTTSGFTISGLGEGTYDFQVSIPDGENIVSTKVQLIVEKKPEIKEGLVINPSYVEGKVNNMIEFKLSLSVGSGEPIEPAFNEYTVTNLDGSPCDSKKLYIEKYNGEFDVNPKAAGTYQLLVTLNHGGKTYTETVTIVAGAKDPDPITFNDFGTLVIPNYSDYAMVTVNPSPYHSDYEISAVDVNGNPTDLIKAVKGDSSAAGWTVTAYAPGTYTVTFSNVTNKGSFTFDVKKEIAISPVPFEITIPAFETSASMTIPVPANIANGGEWTVLDSKTKEPTDGLSIKDLGNNMYEVVAEKEGSYTINCSSAVYVASIDVNVNRGQIPVLFKNVDGEEISALSFTIGKAGAFNLSLAEGVTLNAENAVVIEPAAGLELTAGENGAYTVSASEVGEFTLTFNGKDAAGKDVSGVLNVTVNALPPASLEFMKDGTVEPYENNTVEVELDKVFDIAVYKIGDPENSKGTIKNIKIEPVEGVKQIDNGYYNNLTIKVSKKGVYNLNVTGVYANGEELYGVLTVVAGMKSYAGYNVYFNHGTTPANHDAVKSWNPSNDDPAGVPVKNINDEWIADNQEELIPIGTDSFIVKVSNGNDEEYYGLKSSNILEVSEIPTTVTLTQIKDFTLQNSVMKVKDATSSDEFYMCFNITTNELTISKNVVYETSYKNLLIQLYDDEKGFAEPIIIPVKNDNASYVLNLGNNKFAVGYQDLEANNITWYRLNASATKQFYPQSIQKNLVKYSSAASSCVTGSAFAYDLESGSTTTIENNKKKYVAQVEDGTENEKFQITFNISDTNSPAMKITPIYTDYNLHYGNGTDDHQKVVALESNGGLLFTYNTGADETSMQLWYECPGNVIKTYGSSEDNGELVAEFDENGSFFGYPVEGELMIVDPNMPREVVENSKTIKGLKPNTYYNVYVSYPEQTISIEELPEVLYLRGILNGTSIGNNVDEWQLTADPDGGYYSKRNVRLKEGDIVQLFTSNNEKWGPKEDVTYLITTEMDANDGLSQFNLQKLAKGGNIYSRDVSREVDILVYWPEDVNERKIIIRNASEETPADPQHSSLTIFYGKDSETSHTTDGANYLNGEWLTIDTGYSYRGSSTQNDGLALGYDTFYFRTIDQNGMPKYWIVDETVNAIVKEEGLMTDAPYSLKEVSASVAKSDATNFTRMSQNAALVNTRYDVTFNWTNHTVTLTTNKLWMEQPNQMYLYHLDVDENGKVENLRYKFTEGDDEEYTERTPAEVLEQVHKALAEKADKVYIYDRTDDGVYEHIFRNDDKKDFPQGTRFCIVGRSGQIYNLATEDYAPYSLDNAWFNDEDKSFRMELTRDVNQQPAVVTYLGLENIDAFSRIRANFSGSTTVENEDPDVANTYTFTLELKQEAPVKFVLESTAGNIEVSKDEDSETYSVAGHAMPVDATYVVKAVFADNTEKEYKVVSGDYTINGKDDSFNLQNKIGNDIVVNTSAYSDYSDISIVWNNGRPILTVLPETVEKSVKVYFIDRAGWNDVSVFNFSDSNISRNSDDSVDHREAQSWEEVKLKEEFRNGDRPGQSMSRNLQSIISDGLSMDPGTKVFECNLTVKQFADGSYSRPKLVFSKSDKSKRTNVLYLVDGGIYCNAGKATDSNGNSYVKYPATEFIPRMWFNYMNDVTDQSVEPWTGTEYNSIYVDVPEFYEWASDADDSHEVCVDIQVVDNNGNVSHLTGVPGSRAMVPVEIAGKKLLRVSLAADIIPNGLKVSQINIYPTNTKIYAKTSIWDCQFNGTSENVLTDEEGHTHNSVSHRTDAGDNHSGCYGTLCSLNFNGKDLTFKNGYVYRRAKVDEETKQDQIVPLTSLITPKAIYLASVDTPAALNALDVATGLSVTNGTYNGKKLYRLDAMDAEEPEKMIYYVDGMRQQAQFTIVARFETEGADELVEYSCVENTAMKSGDVNTYKRGGQGVYSIRPVTGATNYNLILTWTENEVVIRANKRNADFLFGIADPNNDNFVAFANRGAVALPSHSDDCGLDGDHDRHLVPIYIEFAPGYNNESYPARLNNLKVTMVRDTEYDKYFPENGKNKPIDIMKFENGSVFKVLKPSTDDERGHAVMYVKGYTAGLTSIRIEQTAVDNDYHRTTIDIPVRIYPSLDGVGLTVNHREIMNDGGYSVVVGPDAFIEHPDDPNSVEFGKRLHLGPTNAEYNINGESVFEIYWAYADQPQGTVVRRAPSVSGLDYGHGVFLPEGSDTNPFEKADASGNSLNLTRYSINNAPEVELGENQSRNLYVQFKQNGIDSPVYALNVTRSSDIPTGVEVIGEENGTEDTEAVYYNLNGVKVNAEKLEPGIYIVVKNGKSEKIFVR